MKAARRKYQQKQRVTTMYQAAKAIKSAAIWLHRLESTMHHLRSPLAALALALALGLAMPAAHAHEGHDDGPAAAPANAAPRFAAASELFELVGVIDGRRLTLYLDHAADNSPVQDARLELEVGGKAAAVTRLGEGLYQAELAAPLADGETPVTATVVAAGDSDLLAAAIDRHASSAAPDHAAWPRATPFAAAAGLLAAALGLWAWRRSRRGAAMRAGGAA